MQTGFDYTAFNYFMYGVIVMLSLLVVLVIVLAWRGLTKLNKYVCFTETGRIRLSAVNQRWGDYFYRAERLSLNEAMMVRVLLDGSFTQAVRVRLLGFFNESHSKRNGMYLTELI